MSTNEFGGQTYDNGGTLSDPMLPIAPDEIGNQEMQEIQRDYSCICFGTQVVNTPPMTIWALVVSILALVGSFIAMGLTGRYVEFLPVVTAVVAFWCPSPLANKDKKQLQILNSRLMQTQRTMLNATRYSIIAPNRVQSS